MPEFPLSLILTSARKRKFLYGPLVLAIIDAPPEPRSSPSATSHKVLPPERSLTTHPSVDLPSKSETHLPSWARAGEARKQAHEKAATQPIDRIMKGVLPGECGRTRPRPVDPKGRLGPHTPDDKGSIGCPLAPVLVDSHGRMDLGVPSWDNRHWSGWSDLVRGVSCPS